tara:strand:+ start:193 stop:1125 length:933 start_codon:yes stop_codon:yes gene_type:complete
LDKETLKKLTKDFPKSVVKKAPPGKFGDYVPHHIYTQRLVDVVPDYDFTYEIVRDKNNSIIGAKCKLQIPGLGTKEEAGEVDSNDLANNNTESELLKLAVSDGIKRCCMRFGIGLELWTGGVTEEEHYAVQKPIQKTGKVKDQVIEKEDDLAKAKQDFAKDVADNPNNKQELAKFMDATIKDKAKRDKLKRKVYDDVVSKGFPKEINDWDASQIEIYKDEVFNANKDKLPDTTEAEEILGAKVTYTGPPTDENKVCPSCTDKGSVVDNRDKKADPKFSKIPDFACQKAPYGSGCGWAAWSGNESIPSEWI